jgi:hypothetical protein
MESFYYKRYTYLSAILQEGKKSLFSFKQIGFNFSKRKFLLYKPRWRIMETRAADDLYKSSIRVFHIQFRSVNRRRNNSISKSTIVVTPRVGVEFT